MITLSKRKILLFFAAILCAMTANAYNQSAVDLYFDNSEAQWSSCYVYIGHSSWTSCYPLTRVSGTQYLWKLAKADFNGGSAWNGATGWVLCYEKWWDSKDESIDKYTWHGAKNVTKKRTSAWSASYIYKTNGTVSVTSDGNTINAYNTTTVSNKNYTVTINTVEGGTLTVKDYDNNAVATGASKIHLTVLKFSATPASGYVLDAVEINDGTNTTTIAAADLATTTHTLTSNVTINPVWRATTSTVTVTATATNGTVTGGGVVEEGTSVTLTATPADGYKFVNWTVGGAEVSTDNPYTFTADADVTVVANFEELPKVTIYFVNNGEWSKVQAYAWGANGTNTSWPGADITDNKLVESEKIGGYDVYAYTVIQGSYTSVIFNDGSAQTADYVWTDGNYYWHNEALNFAGGTKAQAEEKFSVPVEYDHVYLINTNDWAKAHIYTWTPEVAGWPGAAMTKEAEQIAGKDVYSYKVVKGTTFGGMLFNCGGDECKTGDLEWQAGHYYAPSKNKWYATKDDAEKDFAVSTQISYVLMGIAGDWSTGVQMEPNPDNANEYRLLDLVIAEGDAVKVVTLTDGAATAWCGDVEEGSVAYQHDSDGNIILAPGTYDFYYKLNENKVYIGGEPLSDLVAKYYITGNTALVGSTNAWIPNAFEMTNNAGIYTYTFSNVTAGDTCMLKVTDGTWNNCWGFEALAEVPAGVRTGDGGNIIFILAETGDVTITFNGQQITISGDFSTVNLPSYVLMGIAGDWSKGIKLQPYPNNANEYVLQCQDIAAGDAVKVVTIVGGEATEWCGAVKDGSVGCSYDSVGNIVLPAGTYDFYYNLVNKNIYIGSAACVQVVALVGSMNGWNTSASQMRLSNDSTQASVTVMLEAQTYSFKVLCNGEWLGNKWVITRDNCTDWPFEAGDGSGIYNCQITADVAGEYVFTWNLENSTLSVTYPAKGEVYEPIAPDGMRIVYLNTGGSGLWNQGGAKFFAHSWVGDTYAAEQMVLHTGDVYKVNIPTAHTHIKFVRMAAGAVEIVWDSNLLWNQTIDLQIPDGKDCYTIRGWGGDQGAWTKYGEEPFPTPLHNYGSAVPSACEDVMLQAFYWDSNQDKYYGCTRWWDLEKQADEISSSFDLIWLPPSARSSGGVGYHPKEFSNQDSDWGWRSELETLITRLHAGGAKVIADMVVNHIEGNNGWCGFAVQDFGEYGRFEVDGSYIANSDEMNTDPSAGGCNGQATGGNDDGYGGESNYGAARDFAHTNEKVRQMFRAYAKWMIDVMQYDGFRYDYCKGFHMSHVDDYNANAGAYFSVIEYWDGNPDVLWSRIADARENTLAFDFGMKYNVLNSGIASFDYSKCKNPDCLIGRGKGKWAVNFIDNHDTFERGNGSDFGGNSMSSDMKDRLLQANAYILSMPGVPCVFYPHWYIHKEAIKAMISARKAAGVHSESAVSDEVVGNGYRAHVKGSRGTLILELGDAVDQMGSYYGYSEVAAGAGYKMWVTYGSVAPELTIHTNSTIFHTSTMSVTMSAEGGLGTPVIYYTMDGSDPRTSSSRKTYGGAITISGTTVLKACAEASSAMSDVQTRAYTYQEPQRSPITIAFQKPNNWSKVYLYSWDNQENYLTGTWPGKELTATNAAGLYYHMYEDTYDGGINFIFSNGSTQSANLHTYEDVCYGWKNDKAVVVQCSEEAGLIIYHDGTYNPGDGVYEVSEEYVGSITYKRIFTPGKWETIYLPFAVEKVTVEDGGEWKLNPWTVTDGGEYFLAAPDDVLINGEIIFDMVDKLVEKKPYIIQFPRIVGYEDYYVDRVVTFHGSAKWNELPTTFEPEAAVGMQMYGNTTLKQKELVEEVYLLRGTDNFILYPSIMLQPFECYVTPKKATSVALAPKMKVRFRGDDDVTTPLLSTHTQTNALKYMKNDDVLTLYTSGQAVQIYTLNGVMLHSVEPGQEVVAFTLPNGCYVLSSNGNSQKIIM